MEAHKRGDLTEAKVIAEFASRGIPISIPFGDNDRYDLLASTEDGRILRIQVKTGRLKDGVVVFDGKSQHANSTETRYESYREDVDYFVVFCHDLESMYLVPAEQVGSTNHLRVEQPDHDHPRINWAEEYSFDTRWPPDEQILPETNPWYQLEKSAIEALDAIGSSPSIPADDSDAWDLVAELPGCGFVRLKMRKASEKDGRLYVPPGETVCADYDLVYCYDRDQWYLIDVDEYDGALSLWIEEPEQVRRTTRWAEDYELERAWPPTPGRTISRNSLVGTGIEAFREAGATVAVPEDTDLPYDFIVTLDEAEYWCVRVEPGWISSGRIRLKPDSCDGIDWFLLSCRENETAYLVEADEFDRSISLRVDVPENEVPSIKWADAYELSPRLHKIIETDSA